MSNVFNPQRQILKTACKPKKITVVKLNLRQRNSIQLHCVLFLTREVIIFHKFKISFYIDRGTGNSRYNL